MDNNPQLVLPVTAIQKAYDRMIDAPTICADSDAVTTAAIAWMFLGFPDPPLASRLMNFGTYPPLSRNPGNRVGHLHPPRSRLRDLGTSDPPL